MLLPDISEFQPNADLPGIKKANGGGVILRVGYGQSKKDIAFDRHRAAAHASKFPFVGLYHYVRWDQDVFVQARAFDTWVGKLLPGEIPILDLEEGQGNQSSRASIWLNNVDTDFALDHLPLNQRSWLYSGEDFASTRGLLSFFQSARHTWVAAYRSTEPTIPHTLWQSTDGVQGAHRTDWPGAGFCDTNYTSKSLVELAMMAYGSWTHSVLAPTNISTTLHGFSVNVGWDPVIPTPDYYRYMIFHYNNGVGDLVTQDLVTTHGAQGVQLPGGGKYMIKVQARNGPWSEQHIF